MFTEKDLNDFAAVGITPAEAEKQISNFRNGFPFLHVAAPATVGNGISQLSSDDRKKYVELYDGYSGKILKFVPASGAASRMFKALFKAADDLDSGEPLSDGACLFFDNISKFAFYGDLAEQLENDGVDIDDKSGVLRALLGNSGLDYGNSPKGLLLFHSYPEGSRTAFEEHPVEGAYYAKSKGDVVNLHFTVSPEHRTGFEDLLARILPAYENRYGVKFDVVFSEQKKSTNSIAVNPDNTPFRESDGSILLRPAGHGALLENLNDSDADLIFVKNIDNVVHESRIADTVHWKKVLAGLLVETKGRMYEYLAAVDEGRDDEGLLNQAADFIRNTFVMSVNPDRNEIYSVLNRPLRVCGMVKNEGEPGGGPFFAGDAEGRLSLQIAESSQINTNDAEQKKILSQSTHFNPVDLVCSIKDHRGKKFDLTKYSDPSTGFISEKTKDGKTLKAQELPGLWNGAMSNWNTIFVETPISVFNPVKTVNDLLREMHTASSF